ncbi:stability/partitioning determinant [Burkholderiales bacterium GJ-E10]|nr:stability/partitioning determinant [Burkholderiales bacterium GJ-E10]
MSTDRVNPLDDLSDFGAKPSHRRPPTEALDRIARDNGFPTREPIHAIVPPTDGRRRRTTGRNRQINIKATAETIDRLYRLANALQLPLGEVLERALHALEQGSAEAIR